MKTALLVALAVIALLPSMVVAFRPQNGRYQLIIHGSHTYVFDTSTAKIVKVDGVALTP